MSTFKNQSHESFDRKEKIVLGSNKKFGYTFAIIFFVISISPMLIHSKLRFLLILFSLFFAAAALIEPNRLHLINLMWAKFGLLLNKIISPIILALLFYLVFFPTGLLLRLAKKDILGKNLNKKASSYWIDSTVFSVTSMKDQF